MLILDFRTGKMTKLALNLGDVVSVVGPGALFGIGGAGLGSIIDMLAGTNRRWTKILGLLGLAGGAGAGGLGRYLYKREQDPTYQAQRFFKDVQRGLTADDWSRLDATTRQELLQLQPAELFNRLTTSTDGSTNLASYDPRIAEYRFVALLHGPRSGYSEMIPIARGVLAQQVLLSKAWQRFSGQTQQDLPLQFNEYKKALVDWIEAGQKDSPAAALQMLQNMANLIKADGQTEIADALIQFLPIRVGE